MNFLQDSPVEPQRGGALQQRIRLLLFTTLVLVGGALFFAVAGLPHLPMDRLPQAKDVLAVLSGSSLPVEPLVVLLVDLVWLLWIWIVASLCIELLLLSAEAVAHGAVWVISMRSLAERVSIPFVRQVVAAAFTLQVLSRGVPIASAQTLPTAETALILEASSHRDSRAGVDTSSDAPLYLVHEGDTLWLISERAYGTGTEYRRIVDANLGERMPDGQTFTALGVIRPGWQLRLPGASWSIQEVDGERWYMVQPGDSLSSIAGQVLGDRSRWQELFELNSGSVSEDSLHTLVDPDVIWPGFRLQVPRTPDAAPATDSIKATADPEPSDPKPEAADPGPTVVDPELSALAAKQSATPPDARAADPDSSTTEMVTASAAAPPPPADLPPLMRAAHVWDPVVLDSSDTISVETPADDTLPNASDAEVSVPPAPTHQEVPIMPLALGGLGLAAVAGFAFGARHFRRLRPLPRAPENDVVLEHGFVEAEPARDLTRGAHGVGFDPVAALVGQFQQFLAEYNLDDVQVIAVRHGLSSTTLTLRCSLAQQPLLIDLAPVFAERLGAEVEAAVSTDQDVQLKLLQLRKTRLLPTAESVATSPCLLPLGVLYDRQIFFATCQALDHVLVVSMPGLGADMVLTSLVATITARKPPEHLRVWMIAHERALPAPLFDIPHLERVVDPAAEADLQRMADDLRTELDRRAACRADGPPDLVVVVSELTALGAHAEHLALLAPRAADLGVRFVAASNSPEDVALSPMLTQFQTRMVMRMQADEMSRALLGVADARFLSGGGRLCLRIDGRQPIELYGFQVSVEHLERLVKLMRSVYRSSSEQLTEADSVVAESEPPDPPPGVSPAESQPVDVISADSPPEPPEPAVPVEPAQAEIAPFVATIDNVLPQRVRVICFGGPRVYFGNRVIWPNSSVGDAKPWEFLLYLACQPLDGVARDQAVDAMWPEDETPEDAPHRIRQLRYRLRQMLTAIAGAPQPDGVSFERGVLRLDPGIVYSDAQEFLDIVRRARVNPPHDLTSQLERARKLFAGDLLEGPDARRYAWVDERDTSGMTLREHFRRHFQYVSARLAELYVAAGELDGAIVLYRELTEIDPGDERLWRALFRLHTQREDRLALVREEHRMREALRKLADEIDAPENMQCNAPSPETAKEYQRLLATLRDREPLTA